MPMEINVSFNVCLHPFIGIVLLIFTASMAVFSRLYMQAIMAARGVYSIDDYGNFLQVYFHASYCGQWMSCRVW